MNGPHVRCTFTFEIVGIGQPLTHAELYAVKQTVLDHVLVSLAGGAGWVTREHINVFEQVIEIGAEVPVP